METFFTSEIFLALAGMAGFSFNFTTVGRDRWIAVGVAVVAAISLFFIRKWKIEEVLMATGFATGAGYLIPSLWNGFLASTKKKIHQYAPHLVLGGGVVLFATLNPNGFGQLLAALLPFVVIFYGFKIIFKGVGGGKKKRRS